MKKKKKGRIGSSFDSFLKEEGIYEDTQAAAIKKVLAWQIEKEMTAQRITKSSMARRMKTSRSQLDRLLDPDNDKILLQTIQRAAAAVGKRLTISLENSRALKMKKPSAAAA
jgi:antitoxin HicB